MHTARRHLLTLGAAGWAAPAWVRHARAADLPRFELGVASGQPQPAAVVLWTRLTGFDLPAQVPVRWQIAHDEAFSRIAASGTETAEPASAHSVHAEVAGLAPGRGYFYRFNALGQQSATGRTRTAPAADAPASLHAVVTSCQRYDHGLYAAWRDVAAREPDLVMFLGDYLYEYASPAGVVRAHDGPLLRTLDQFRARYAQYKSDPALQAAHAAAPWLLVWDDHEVETTTPTAKAARCGVPTCGGCVQRPTRPGGSTSRCPRRCARWGPTPASSTGWTGAAWPASTRWTAASTVTTRLAGP